MCCSGAPSHPWLALDVHNSSRFLMVKVCVCFRATLDDVYVDKVRHTLNVGYTGCMLTTSLDICIDILFFVKLFRFGWSYYRYFIKRRFSQSLQSCDGSTETPVLLGSGKSVTICFFRPIMRKKSTKHLWSYHFARPIILHYSIW